jgi:hypothetical protein
MAINKVDLTVSQIINDLNSGLTWLKKDDLGYGSIETKYNANALQIATIRKHPSLKDAETSITIFNIIDDTKNETTKGSVSNGTSKNVQQPTLDMVSEQKEMDTVSSESTEAADIFANL